MLGAGDCNTHDLPTVAFELDARRGFGKVKGEGWVVDEAARRLECCGEIVYFIGYIMRAAKGPNLFRRFPTDLKHWLIGIASPAAHAAVAAVKGSSSFRAGWNYLDPPRRHVVLAFLLRIGLLATDRHFKAVRGRHCYWLCA